MHEIAERLVKIFIKKLFGLPYNAPNYILSLETCIELFSQLDWLQLYYKDF